MIRDQYKYSWMLTPQETSNFLNVGTQTLRNWRTGGVGPSYVVLSTGAVRYRIEDLEAFVQSKRVTPEHAEATQ